MLIYAEISKSKYHINIKFCKNGIHHHFLKDHLGNVCAVVQSETDEVVQSTLYYASGVPMSQSWGRDKQPYLYNGKEFVEAHGLNEYDSKARMYYAPIMRTTTIDPMAEDYYHISPYSWCENNPVKYIDPDGRWIAVTSNDDTGTSYEVVGGAVEVEDCNVYIVGNDYNTKNDGKPSNVEILGQTVTPYSFCNEKGEVESGSTINMNDKSGDAFIARFQNDEVPLIGYILPPNLSNESGWPNGGCDFKSGDNPNRGMPLTILGGKIGTARDIGNFAAGFLAASNGITGRTTRTVFDVFQNLTTTGCTTGEPPVSWWAQQLGHDYGRASRFVNRVCQPNIYNAYR